MTRVVSSAVTARPCEAACATSGRGRGAKLAVVAARQVAPPVQVVVRVGAVRCGASTRVGLALAPARRRSSVLRAVTTEAMTEEEDATDDNTEEDLDEYMSFTEVVDEVLEAEEAAQEAEEAAGRKGRGKRGQAKKGQDKAGASSISSGVRVEGLAKSFKNVEVLRNINWECQTGERVGLVGNNGAGKTTQLRIITGEMEADEGTVLLAKRSQVAYLTQEFEVVDTRTVREEFLTVFSAQLDLAKELDDTEKALEGCVDDMDRMQELIEKMGELQGRMDNVDMFEVDKQIEIMMSSMGFTEEDNDRLVASYSGGWQMRMSLGKILLQNPDLLLLDEPTNHLDLETVEWLENYLKEQTVPMVIVSHDRAFLDQLCTKIVETERGVSKTWRGNYSEYLAQKQTWITAQMAAWERQQKELARQTEMISRLSGGGQAGRAEAAKKAMEKMKTEGSLVKKPFIEKKRRFEFPDMGKSGRIVARCENLSHGYGAKSLFTDANLLVEAGERVAFVGPNGCGKSTFLRLLLDQEKPDSGSVQLGDHQVVPNFFSQNQAETLDHNRTVLETLELSGSNKPISELKMLLGRFMFQGDQVHKKIEFLSGGEKARVALALFLVTPATLLVLDEPTNHLDISSKEMLEEAVKSFPGTVLAVSHDRYFLRQIATRVVDVRDGQFNAYQGDYQYFLDSNDDAAAKESRFAEKEKEVAQSTIKAKSKMSKAEKMAEKKAKAKSFANGSGAAKVKKNAGRWN